MEKQTDAVVQHHFYGSAGLKAHLQHVGNWDDENDCILDTRALGNGDETPQFFMYAAQGTRKSGSLWERAAPREVDATVA